MSKTDIERLHDELMQNPEYRWEYEAAKIEKGCNACGLIYKLDGASYGTEDEVINNPYCPMCGRRLEVKQDG